MDANVLSEPTKPAPDLRVVEWLRNHERDLAVDPIILGELEYGILLLPIAAAALFWNSGSPPVSSACGCSTSTPRLPPHGHASLPGLR